MSTLPPRRAEALLERVLPPEDRSTVPDELRELYAGRVRARGVSAARRWYWRVVMGFAARIVLRAVAPGWRRDSAWEGMMMGFGTELSVAARRLWRAPVFTMVATLTLAAGIGAFGAVFAVVDGVLLEPPDWEDPEELRYVWRSYSFLDRGWLGGPDVARLAELDAFDGAMAMRTTSANLTADDGGAPRSVVVTLVTANFFDLLGVPPRPGRGFAPGEDGADAAAVTVLSHDLWRTRYAADPSIVGRDLFIDGSRTTVIGIAPEDFHFVQHSSLGQPVAADLWMPMPFDLATMNAGNGMFAGVVRIADGVDPASAEEAVASVGRVLDDQFGNPGVGMWSVGVTEDLVAASRPALLALLGAALFLLAVLAANLTTLFLGRAVLRARELAVRAALGAGRGRLVRSAVAETVVVGIAGLGLGVIMTGWGVSLIRRIAPPDLPRLWAIEADLSVTAATVLVAGLVTATAGLLPSVGVLKLGLVRRLRAGGRAGASGSARVRSGLVVVQLALSLVLLVGAGLLADAFLALTRADPGFDGDDVLTFRVPLDPTAYPDDPAAVSFIDAFQAELGALPGITAVGAADELPLTAGASQVGAAFPGAPGNTGDEDADQPLVDLVRSGPGYAEAMGLRILTGRSFRDGDGSAGSEVALIDDVLAQRFFPGGDPIGAPLMVAGDTVTVVGVVDQPRQYTVHADDRGQVMLPLAWSTPSDPVFALRTDLPDDVVIPAVRAALGRIDDALPLAEVRRMEAIAATSLGRERLSFILLLTFAGSALLLSMLGVYGVVSNAVARRTREMGVRMALGAAQDRVLRLILGQGLRLAAIGLLLGGAGAGLLAPALRSVVVGLNPGAAEVYAGAALGLLAVTVLASLVPARRATRIDPATAIRAE